MKPFCFVLDDYATASTPTAILTGEWRCRRLHKPQRFQRLYLDSLDWRLLRRNLYLIADLMGGEYQLQLVNLRDNQMLATAAVRDFPDFTHSLPLGKISTVLTPVLESRALISQITLSVTRLPMMVFDGNEDAIAYLDLEASNPQMADCDESMHVYRRLWFTPVEGYERQNKAIINALSEYGLPMFNAVIPVSYLVSALNIDTAKFATKPNLVLDPAQRADSAVKQLLAFLLSVIEANRPPLVADIDSECLHDFRVAVRRIRTLLAQSRGVIDQARRDRAKAFLARINRVTTPQRDFDVMLLNFDFYRSLSTPRMREHLEPIHDFVVMQRRAAAQATVRAVQAASYQRFITNWLRYLEAHTTHRVTLKNATKSVKELADARIWKAYKRVINDGGEIDADAPSESLHNLRKRCKTLRYLIEFFTSLYPAKKIKRVLAQLKRLQDHLGAFQDLHVHIDLISNVRAELAGRGLLSGSADDAITQVVEALSNRQADYRRHFRERFEVFSDPSHHHLYRQLFKP